ncbi:MAG TPA: PRC-barrel domain-containing protein [Woeseiaceae bacterium]
MSKWLTALAALALASGAAFAGQDTAQEDTMDEVGQPTGQQDPAMPEDPTRADEPVMGEEQPPMESQYPEDQMEMSQSVADMSAAELAGKAIVTPDGEEIGEIDRIGQQSDMPQERVAAVDVGGFLGVGAKTVAIPLSKLEMTSDGNLRTSLTREELESQQALDEETFTEETTDSQDSEY